MDTVTRDPTRPQARQDAAAREEALLVVLYHGDLSMVGRVFRLPAEEWVVVGREEPRFEAPWASQELRALADPCVSRKQLRVRWRVEGGGLEVEALPEARRPLTRLGSGGEAIEGDELRSGGCVAVGDRMLLGFVVRPGVNLDLAGGLVGESEPFAELCQQISAAALCDDPVVIRGEPDSGVEQVVRAVHQASSRRGSPMRVVRAQDLDEQALLDEVEQGKEIPLLVEGSERLSESAQARLFERLNGLLARLRFGALRGSLRLYLTRRPGAEVPLAGPTAVVDVPALADRALDVPLLFVQALRRRLLFQEQSAGTRSWLMAALWKSVDTHDHPLPMAFFVSLLRHGWPGQLTEVEALAAALVQGSMQARSLVLPSLAAEARREEKPGPVAVTSQQKRILDRVRDGLSSKEIGDQLGCSHRTVESHLAQLFRKSSTNNRVQLVAWANKNKI